MEKIVVGVDFSSESELAARQAIAIGRRTGAEVVLAHVASTVELPPVGPEPADRVRAALDTYRTLVSRDIGRDRERLSELREQLGGQGPVVSQVLAEGYADAVLASSAAELGADLLVVGTHGRAGLQWFLLGSTAQKIIRSADVDVLVARRECPPGGYRRVLAAIDFTPSSLRALDRAIEMAAPAARIDVAYFYQLAGTGWGTALAIDPELTAETARAVARQVEPILAERRRRASDLRFAALEQPAIPGIVHLAERQPYDLVVVGSHGRRGLRRAFLGSVAETVARRAPCSVLVARGPVVD